MAWYGLIYGLGMVWYGIIWCGIKWYMVWYGFGMESILWTWYGFGIIWCGRAFIMVVIDMSDSAPAVHYNSLPRIAKQRFIFAKWFDAIQIYQLIFRLCQFVMLLSAGYLIVRLCTNMHICTTGSQLITIVQQYAQPDHDWLPLSKIGAIQRWIRIDCLQAKQVRRMVLREKKKTATLLLGRLTIGRLGAVRNAQYWSVGWWRCLITIWG